jgi:multidrug efflux system outer membrane protein
MAAAKLRRRLSLSAALSLGVLAACTLEPRYRAPALPVPDRWPIPATTAAVSEGEPLAASDAAGGGGGGGGVGGGGAAPVRDIGWRDFFVDARLQQLIALALANNRDLRVAVLNIQLARAQYRVQRGNLLPTVDGSAQFNKEKLPAAVSGVGFPITESYYDVGLGITSYELDLFGRVRSLTRAALEQYFAQAQARRSAQLSLIAEVANAYLTLASDQQLLQLSKQTLKSQEDSFELTRRRHESGAVSGLDLAQSETTVDSARADVARYEGNVDQDVDALTLLVGAPLDAALLPQDFDAKTMGVEALPAELPSTVLLRRPDVLQAEHVLRADNADIGAARAAFFPTISLTGSIGSASSALSGLFKSGTGTWAFMPQATLPIFQGGALLAGLDEARTQRSIAVAQYEKAIQTGFREVADSLALTATLERERAAQAALVDATGRAFDLSNQRYKTGAASYLDVLVTQRSYYAAQQSLIATRLAEQSNRVTLYKALGGGWQEHSSGNTPGR